MSTATLSDRMTALADTGHAQAQALRTRAEELRKAAVAYFDHEPPLIPVGQFVGAWARARRLWCNCTGEPLV